MRQLKAQKAEKRKKSVIKGIIADTERAATHDGSGIRTTVFFKGCPLNCRWCHNPECIDFKPQMMHYPEKCIGCGKCDEGCFSGARVICGKEYNTDTLMKEILLDKDYYGENGGVTFSGGEPLAQPEFLKLMIEECKNEGIGCAVETSLFYYNEEIFKKLDFVMADFKIWDSGIHKEYTGVPNERIKENFRKLNKLDIPIIARTPVIPGVRQEIDKISVFLKNLQNVKQYELLPYHPMGNSKRVALGMQPDGFAVPTKEYMKELNKYAFVR